MQRIFKWINRHKVLTIAVLLLIIFLPLIIIHIVFKFHTDCFWLKAEWSAGEILGYLGDVMSFVGTVTLGYVAIKQTEQSNSLSNRMVQLEEDRRMPLLEIQQQNYRCNLYFRKKDIVKCREKYNALEDMKVELTFRRTEKVGSLKTIASMIVKVKNIGNSDIKGIMVRDSYCNLGDGIYKEGVECEFPIWGGNTYIKRNQTKKLFVEIKMDIDKIDKKDILKHINYPEFNFDLLIEAPDELYYTEHFLFYIDSINLKKSGKNKICYLCSQQTSVRKINRNPN